MLLASYLADLLDSERLPLLKLEGGEEFLADQEERERAKALIDALPLHK